MNLLKNLNLSNLLFAVIFCFAGRTLAQSNQNKLDSLIANSAYFESSDQYLKAAEIFKEIISKLESSHSNFPLYQSKLHSSKGRYFSLLQDYDQAQQHFDLALSNSESLLEYKHENYLKELYINAYHNLANNGEWEKAVEYAMEGYSLLKSNLNPSDKADMVYDIGFLYDRNKLLYKALEYYKESIVIYESLPDNQLEISSLALAYNNLGTIYAETGFFTQRKACYLRAKELWESDPEVDKSYLITIYGNLMRLYRTYGDKEGAEELIDAINSNFDLWKNEEMFGESGVQTEQKPKLLYDVDKHRINIMYADLKDDQNLALVHLDSLREYYKLMPRNDREKYANHLISSIINTGALFYDYKDKEIRKRKEELLELALKESLEYKNFYNEMLIYSEYCKYWLFSDNDLDKALHFLDKALAIGKENNIREVNLLNLLLKKGDVLQQLGEFQKADSLVKYAFTLMLEKEVDNLTVVDMVDFKERNSVYYINALKEVANIYRNQFLQTKNPNLGTISYHFYDLAAQVFQNYYDKGAYNPYLNMTSSDIHEGLTELHILLEDPNTENLLVQWENNSSQLLWREFESKYQHYLSVPDSLVFKHSILRTELTNEISAIQGSKENTKEIATELSENESHISSIDENYLTFFSDELNLSTLKENLSEDRMMIRFRITDKKLFAFMVSASGIQVKDLGDKNPVLELVEEYHSRIQSIQPNVIELSTKLYTHLIQPLELKNHDFEQLVIIPDGKLNFLAFETLRNLENDTLLVEEYAISYSYSLKLWELQHAKSTSLASKKAVAAFVPEYSQSYLASMDDSPISRGRLTHLEGAHSEANFIVDRLGGEIFQKEEANKSHFLESIGKYQIYHFATHAVIDKLDYENSGLYFQNGEIMSYSELYNMHFPAELVVLSACNTGIGELQSGEGLMSLSRALTYAGVKASVYSLWQVPDEETSEIMRSFYGYLNEGRDKEESLSMAKRKFLIDNPMKQHPFYWAGFVLNGNMKALPIDNKWMPIWGYSMCLGIAVIIIGMIILNYRKRLYL